MRIRAFISRWPDELFGTEEAEPWVITGSATDLLRRAIASLGPHYKMRGEVALHVSAEIEIGATIKGTAIIGPGAFVSSSALLRGGVFLGEGCIVGPGVELKTTFMLNGSKAAHLNFVGDSILGSDVNLEAGSMIANYRNELIDKQIRIAVDDRVIDTGVDKFGALIGDGSRVGANAVIAPGALLAPNSRVPRLGLVDHYPRGS